MTGKVSDPVHRVSHKRERTRPVHLYQLNCRQQTYQMQQHLHIRNPLVRHNLLSLPRRVRLYPDNAEPGRLDWAASDFEQCRKNAPRVVLKVRKILPIVRVG
jgi:hypothetical protein